MKTTNNAQKTILSQTLTMVIRGASMIFIVIMISWSVSAQRFWNDLLSNYNEETIENPTFALGSETRKADAATEAILTELNLNSKSNSSWVVEEIQAEEEMTVEDWMTKESNFTSLEFMLTEEVEEPIMLEDWMIDNENFGQRFEIENSSVEQTMQIEDWMLNEKNFTGHEMEAENEPAMELEAWMLNETLFCNN